MTKSISFGYTGAIFKIGGYAYILGIFLIFFGLYILFYEYKKIKKRPIKIMG
ncbi:hypothetical protein [uncultured Gammaproteobacteria bacterium]|nr:hypothetical protein [uncultured Gammaproteobacteria bacterium]CAC9595356.1 hypothetical protein [uncultured Gammaproteobacteria bacterium]CAC9958241.1 hypothetical protein [uncultured Gammaproteobacteria bacterium]